MRPIFLLRSMLVALGCLGAAMAQAGVVQRLDDSASPRNYVQSRVDLGTPLAPRGDPTSPLVDVVFGRIEYRLATAAYAGHQARIYYVIPAGIPGLRSPTGLRVEWRGDGRFSDGSGRPGDRVLVWSGLVDGPWMNETLDLRMQLDLREIRSTRGISLGFESYFEIEVLP